MKTNDGKSDESNGDSSPEGFEKALNDKFSHFSINDEIRQIAERVRREAIVELRLAGEKCDEKQSIINSIEVVKGTRADEYLVVSEGNYGKDLEFGTTKSLQSPWFAPAFVTVAGSIHKCLQGALKRALQKIRRASRSQVNSGPAVIGSGSRYIKPKPIGRL